MNSGDGYKKSYNRNQRQGSQNFDDDEVDWKHDKYQDKGQNKGKKGKRSKYYKNQNYGRIDRNQKIDFSKDWAHDKFQQFESGFGMPPLMEDLSQKSEKGSKKDYYPKKKKKWKNGDKNQRKKISLDNKPKKRRLDRMYVTLYSREGERVEVNFPIIKENEEKEPNLKQNLNELFEDMNFSRIEKIEAIIAVVSLMVKKSQNGANRYKGLLNFYIREYLDEEEKSRDKNKIFRMN